MSVVQSSKYSKEDVTFIIRNANTKDAEELINLMRVLDNETTFLLRESDEFTLTVEQEKQFIQDKLDSEVELFVVAEVEGKIVGTCGLTGNIRRRLRHTANLAIAIESKYWGLGIGKKLMETVISWAKANGICRITLEVDTVNYRALSLYTRMGFEVEGTFKNDKKLADGTYRNGYAMALLLND